MSLSKKYDIYYHRVSTQESLNIDLNTSQLMLENYNKEIYHEIYHKEMYSLSLRY